MARKVTDLDFERTMFYVSRDESRSEIKCCNPKRIKDGTHLPKKKGEKGGGRGGIKERKVQKRAEKQSGI